MRIYLKIILYLFTIFLVLYTSSVSYPQVFIFLLFSIIDVIYEKYNKKQYLLIIQAMLFIFSAIYYQQFVFLVPKLVSDIYLKLNKKYILFLSSVALPFINNILYISFYIVLSLLTFIIIILEQEYNESKINYRRLFDSERISKYQLEEAYMRLERLSNQAVQIAELNERNRIAREIHDNVGHNIAGVLLQLQAAKALIKNNDEKGLMFLDNSIVRLSEGLDILRNTVHNLKPKITYDFNYIKNIIESFNFCPTSFSVNGSIEKIKPYHVETLSMILKEALTNTSKHSNATYIDIKIDIYQKFIRFYIKDNGVGAKVIKEGMGLSNIKERIRNVGGEVSFSGDNGFMIVAIIPFIKEGVED
ncbi:sensor histidine kinase [Caldicellulosiruptoraceae bacterium PP1]